jgi:hypothetical protein
MTKSTPLWVFVICVLLAAALGPAPARAVENMLQFKAGSHILAFLPDKAYLASLDHALSVEFLATEGVMPRADSGGSVPGASISSLTRVVYEGLWKGISLTYEATKDGITETTYLVSPGADVSAIRLRYNVPVELQSDGSLKFDFKTGYVTASSPVAWQDIDGKRVPVTVAFRVSEGVIGFSVGAYNPRYPLTIDPTYAWHTFYGSNSDEVAYAIAVDGSGNIYVAGSGYKWDGPSGQAPLHAYSNGGDFFVLKLNSAGAYQWHTFYGSSTSSSYAYGIAVDGDGNLYVTGSSTGSWSGPGTPAPAPLHAFSTVQYAFVLKLNTNGAYQWHTFYGAGGSAIALDGGGGVYVTGGAASTWNGPSGQLPRHAFTTSLPGWNYSDIGVLKLDTNGAYQWHTFYGASNAGETGRSIAVGGDGVYVTGTSDKSWTGQSATPPLHAFTPGTYNLFVLKLNGNGAYQWHTFYGSANGGESGNGIAADAAGNVYVAGKSSDPWNGPAGQAPVHAYAGTLGGFVGNILVLKLDSAGAYQWHTYYGSTIGNNGSCIALDTSGGVYVAGNSSGTWTGPAGQAPVHAYGSGYSIVILKLDGNGAYQWHDFYGSPATSYPNGMALNGPDMVNISGYSTSLWNGPAGQAPLHARASGWEIFVLKTSVALPTVATLAISGITPVSATGGGDVTSVGGADVTVRGVCWGTSASPTTANTCTSDGAGTGAFLSSLTGLLPNTLYHVRAYATNAGGTAYGNDVQFTSGPAISLVSGWNFISSPKQPPDAAIGTVLAGVSSNVEIVWGYHNENKVWQKWKPGDNVSNLTFDSDRGYWIYMNALGYVDSTNWTTPTSTTVTLYQGWNLIGYMGTNGTSLATALSTLQNNWSLVWGWDAGQWNAKHVTIQALPAPIQPLSIFNQGKAYWINVNQGQPTFWTQ